MTPAVLLTLLCGVGVGQGLTAPIAQTLQPELVPPSERPQAIALGSVNQNLARAIGPAIGGLLLAATSAALVFFVNAASFLAVIIVVAMVAVPARGPAGGENPDESELRSAREHDRAHRHGLDHAELAVADTAPKVTPNAPA